MTNIKVEPSLEGPNCTANSIAKVMEMVFGDPKVEKVVTDLIHTGMVTLSGEMTSERFAIERLKSEGMVRRAPSVQATGAEIYVFSGKGVAALGGWPSRRRDAAAI